MGIKRIAHSTLEGIINTVRISPHGFVGLVGTALFLDATQDGGLHAQLPHWAQATQVWTGLFLNTLSGLVPFGFIKYFEYKRFIKNHGFDARHVDVSIKPYCNRQAYKAAAYSLGYREEFDQVNSSKPKYEKHYHWMPEL